ncbi:MAG: DUF1961 family protein [Cyclobacteriaceae bacterium]
MTESQTSRLNPIFVIAALILFFQYTNTNAQVAEQTEFDKVNALRWKKVLTDDGIKDWKENWFLDGLKAKVENTIGGMVFSAGPIDGDDAHHAVLWTKESFEGDIKIEYEYTRMDNRQARVNILYIQATGVAPNAADISEWNHLREVPSMRTYFNNINCLHISYAAYGKTGDVEYVRARKYPRHPDKKFGLSTEIPTASFDTGLFLTGETYKITAIKTAERLYFHVKGKDIEKLFSWDLKDIDPVVVGRIGLRHMYTRSSRYKNFRIYTK